MQCDPRALLKQAPPFLSPYLGPSLNLWRRPRTLQTGVEWVRNDRRAPGSWDDGQMPSCRGKERGSSTPKSIALCLAQSSSSLIFQSHG